VVAALAVMKAGVRTFRSIPTIRGERIAFMLEDAKLAVVITSERQSRSSCARHARATLVRD
jgi:non-ribosomal peptide synthetase component F